MLSIGEFSDICRLSIKALRHYDQIGLLRPAWTDPESGYRYYKEDQLERALVITRLKSYGFSLAEIKDFLQKDKGQDERLYLLQDRLAKLDEEICMKRTRLNELKNYILQYERTGSLMPKTIAAIQEDDLPATPIFEVRDTISMDQMGQMFSRIFETAGPQGIVPAGPVGAVYYDREFDPDHADTGVFFISDAACANSSLPAGKSISLIHKGAYSTFGESYAALHQYMKTHSLEPAGPPWELYMKGSFQKLPVEQWETKIVFPVKTTAVQN